MPLENSVIQESENCQHVRLELFQQLLYWESCDSHYLQLNDTTFKLPMVYSDVLSISWTRSRKNYDIDSTAV